MMDLSTQAGNLSDVEDRVIIIDSVSKRYSAYVGCVASKNEEL